MIWGVNDHHKNGIQERMLMSLSETSGKMMIRAKKRHPSTISTNLCPYALKMTI